MLEPRSSIHSRHVALYAAFTRQRDPGDPQQLASVVVCARRCVHSSRLAACRQCHSFPFESNRNRGRTQLEAHSTTCGAATSCSSSSSRGCRDARSWRRNRRRRNRQRLGAKPQDDTPESGGSKVILDAEFSDIIEIERADQESKRKGWEQEQEQEQESPPVEGTKQGKEEAAGPTTRGEANKGAKKKSAARGPAPAPAPFAFPGSGFASLEDAAASGQFIDLSDGRSSCLKRVDDAGLGSEGNPAKGSKVDHTLMILLYSVVLCSTIPSSS